MINNALCQNPGPTLVAFFGLGIAVGLLIAAWIMYLYLVIGRHTERRNWIAEEQAALGAREEQDVVIDDDRMMCEVCWQERHPGLRWSLFGTRGRNYLCKTHAEVQPYEPNTDEAALEEVLYALAS